MSNNNEFREYMQDLKVYGYEDFDKLPLDQKLCAIGHWLTRHHDKGDVRDYVLDTQNTDDIVTSAIKYLIAHDAAPEKKEEAAERLLKSIVEGIANHRYEELKQEAEEILDEFQDDPDDEEVPSYRRFRRPGA